MPIAPEGVTSEVDSTYLKVLDSHAVEARRKRKLISDAVKKRANSWEHYEF